MRLADALQAYLAGLGVPRRGEVDGDGRPLEPTPHQQQAVIILMRFVAWLEMPRPSLVVGGESRVVQIFSEITSQDVTEFLRWRERQPGLRSGTKVAPATINKELRYIRCWLVYAEQDRLTFGLSIEWRMPRCKWVPTDKTTPPSLTVQSLDAVFDSCDHATRPKLDNVSPPIWWRTLLYVTYLTSMRRRALFGFPRPPDFELDQMVLNVPAKYDKSRQDRLYHLTPVAVEWIRKLPAKPGEPLFRWDRENLRSFYTHLHLMQDKAKIPADQHGLPHLLRKSHATHLAQEQVPLAVVQRQLGHSTPAITEKYYVGSLDSQRKDAVQKLMVPKSMRSDARQKTLPFD